MSDAFDLKDPLKRRYRRFGTLLAVLVYAFLLVPSLIVIPVSFGTQHELRFPPREFSFELYQIFFSSSAWTEPLLQSAKIALMTTILALVTAVPAAYGIVRYEFPGKKAITILMMSPLVIPAIVMALGLYLYFSYLRLTGTTLALVLGHTIYVTPFVIVMVAAGVQKLDPNLEFGATLMGAGRYRMFATVVLPQLMPSILAGGLFAFLISFDEVVISWFLVSATTTTLPVKMYSSIQWEISPVIAAVSTMLTALSFIICMLTAALQRRDEPGR
jgi:putative spermidine/putrescine transport system permease protein